MSGEEDYESVSGGSDVQSEVLSERQMEYNLKMARERRKTLKLELALANSASRSREPSPAGSASPSCRNNGLRYHAKMLAGAFPKFPMDAEVPTWFESVESTLLAHEVPKEFWGQIVFPIIAERVEYLSTRLTPAQHRDYESVKEVVVEELRLSPLEVPKAVPRGPQAYINFYVEARGASTFEKLLDLLVADQLKTGLTEEALKYVRLREGASWFDASESAKLLQTFEGAAGNKDASAGLTGPRQGLTNRARGNVTHASNATRRVTCARTAHVSGSDRQARQTRQRAQKGLIARVATEGPTGVKDRLTSSIVPDALTESHGNREACVRVWGNKAGQAIFSNVVEGTPVLCALTDKLTSRTDCLLSAEDWGVLQENRDQEQEATGMVAPTDEAR
ncbi:hypothetical protein HPB48_000433 [Haemaphysalis longicornis]|uniref:Uncharacterized protein n=1 Tax=Haemaphysalis longicornis TaxID=44386 RepID=A0A9J6FDC4_HAELO|nr:hypothetical protein HPB48_000433 [Haemaphysalis longicornis]